MWGGRKIISYEIQGMGAQKYIEGRESTFLKAEACRICKEFHGDEKQFTSMPMMKFQGPSLVECQKTLGASALRGSQG